MNSASNRLDYRCLNDTEDGCVLGFYFVVLELKCEVTAEDW